jgi:ribosomal protein L14E/L6E/L27E
MLVEEWRPQLVCKGFNCDNLSPNGQVFFIDEGHKYYHQDDIIDGELVKFEDSEYKFRSPTGILAKFKEYFDTELQAKKYVKKHNLNITWEELADQWAEKGRVASEEGTMLHAYAEALWNDWDMDAPDVLKTKYVQQMHKDLSETFELVKTELLVYSKKLRLAGQVDLLLKAQGTSDLALMDYKFLKEDIKKRSFYNPRTRRYKYMKGPFKRLHDCNYNHYSIQMEIYRYLMGQLGDKVKAKVLIVVTPDGYELVEGREMSIWVGQSGLLHAKYRDDRGKLYNSSKDKTYIKNGYKLI